MINIENELPPEIGDEIIQETENQEVAEKEYRVGTVQLDEEGEQEESESDALYEHHRFVNNMKEPPRVDKFLMDRISFVSRSKIQLSIKAGSVLVNDKEVKANHKLRIGDVVTVVLATPPREGEVLPENIPLEVVYEDADLMVINKPAGLVVHPGLGNRNGTLVNALAYYFKAKGSMPTMNEGEKERLGLVHRIDKDTSGLLLIAKTEYAMTHLAKQFYNHTVHRRYVALVWGDFEEDEGTVTGHIGRDPKDAMIFKVFPEGDEGSKHAVTHYKVLERFYYTTLVECRLETGRTHQIRVHMRYIGHTLFSDKRYGGNRVLKGTMFSKYKQFVENTFNILPRQALHAKEIGFVHPTTGEAMLFKSEMPADIMAAIEKWRHYVHYRKGLIEQSIVHPTIMPDDF